MRKRRGQMIMLMALVLVLLVLSIAITLHGSSIVYQRVRYEETKEIIDGIAEDSRRLLVNVLSFSTESYKVDGVVPLEKVHYYFSYWSQTILQAYSSRGVQVRLTESPSPIELNWGTNPANSSIKGKLDVNIPRMNFFGWNKSYEVSLNVRLNNVYLFWNKGAIVSQYLNLTVTKEDGLPVESLKMNSFNLNQPIKNIYNLGGGNYIIELDVTENPEILFNSIKINITDDRGISVSLSAMPSARVLFYDGFELGFNKTAWKGIWNPDNSTAPVFMNVTGNAPAKVNNQDKKNNTVSDDDGTIPHSGSWMLMMGHRDFNWEPRPLARDSLKVTLDITGAKNVTIRVWFRMASRDNSNYDYLSIWANRTNGEQLYLKNTTVIQQYNPNQVNDQNRGNKYTIDNGWVLATGNFAGEGYTSLTLIFQLTTGSDQMYKSWVYIDDVQVVAYY